MIKVSEVIEACARVVDDTQECYQTGSGEAADALSLCAKDIRALAAKYEGNRVIEPDEAIYKRIADNYAKDCPHGACPTMKNGVHEMTEPIKLPPIPHEWSMCLGEWSSPVYDHTAMHDYARLAVEQATADLRAELEAMADLAETRRVTLDAQTSELCQLMADKETLLAVWKGEEAEHARETEDRIKAEAKRDEAIKDRDDVLASYADACQQLLDAEKAGDEARATLERCREVNNATAEGWRKTQIELDEARAELARVTTWVSVADEMPKSGRIVLALYDNELGNRRRIRAKWLAAKSEESTDESETSEYDEEADTYWLPEGWYECIDNWDDYSSVFVHHTITHWTPLPPVKEADHPCGACSGTGRVPRDPDIGTDRECWVCDGSGNVKEAGK
jgi:hypothetical protein